MTVHKTRLPPAAITWLCQLICTTAIHAKTEVELTDVDERNQQTCTSWNCCAEGQVCRGWPAMGGLRTKNRLSPIAFALTAVL